MFRDQDIYRSIHAVENGIPVHEALADAGPSLIDLWELEEPDERQDIEGWDAPFDKRLRDQPEVKLARRIQAEIKSLVDSGTMTGTPASAAGAALRRHADSGAPARQRRSMPSSRR